MIVYCPYCGRERSLFSMGKIGGVLELEWKPCPNSLCRGRLITLVTDNRGFIIHPNHLRGQYTKRRHIKESPTERNKKRKK